MANAIGHGGAITTAQVGSLSAADVPRYILFGDESVRSDWFVNVEPLDRRPRDSGWVIAPHTHPRFTQMAFCTAGGGDLSVEGETRAFGPGSVLVVPPHTIHGFHYQEDSNGWVVTIERNYLADLLVRAPALTAIVEAPGIFAFDADVMCVIVNHITSLCDELHDMREAKAIGAEIGLLSVLLTLLRHWPADETLRQKGVDGRAGLVGRYKELLERRYREQPHLSHLARELGVSQSQLRMACGSIAGMSPLELMHDRTLAEAQRCLAYTAMSVGEIADWLGFSDASYFSRFFKQAAGEPPTAYRRKKAF